MPEKIAKTIAEQISLLKSRGMVFKNDNQAKEILSRVSYYRLEGYWWDMQVDKSLHLFGNDALFENVIQRYDFDRKLRMILFRAIEYVEIALRTKLIYYLSLSYGTHWYFNDELFDNKELRTEHCDKLLDDFMFSKEAFAIDHRNRYPVQKPEAWKIFEIASLGQLSKVYKNLKHQLPEKAKIANDFGLSMHSELSSWLESIVYIRNIVAHHSRIWGRNMVKYPKYTLNNPSDKWLKSELNRSEKKKAFLIISTMIYLCDRVEKGNRVRKDILKLFCEFPNLPIYKIGFTDAWLKHPLWS